MREVRKRERWLGRERNGLFFKLDRIIEEKMALTKIIAEIS